MNHIKKERVVRKYLACCAVILMAFQGNEGVAQPARGKAAVSPIILLGFEGKVETSRGGAAAWAAAATNDVLRTGDRIRTRANSRAVLRWSDASMVRMDQLSELTVQPPTGGRGLFGWELPRGVLYFFHRERPEDVRFRTRTATAAVRGTEFNVEAREDGTTILTVIDGVVELRNDVDFIDLNSGDQGIATPGVRPTKTAVIDIVNVIQWCLYYPAMLHADELTLAPAELAALNESLAAYRSGDVLQALAKYPDGRQPASSMEQVYLAAVLLAVGRVDQSKPLIDLLMADATQPQAARLASALGRLVAAVKRQPWPQTAPPELATEWLGESYYRQANGDLKGALNAARQAVDKAPNFGFGWARVAELEFSFGRIGAALEALDKSLELAPRNAEALSLKGFLLGAQNRIRSAIEYFDRALQIDGALGNAWLGRGLCRIRQGNTAAGLEDLQTAATVEPQRALLRSYLGKAYTTEGARRKAAKELQLAKQFDKNDPTAWLYSALLFQQDNRINEAVRDLEHSQELNNNRQVYRSRLLLDQDRAMRSANQANIYRDAGLTDWSVREASRALASDYANYSAHLFLANSYDELRDPNRVNLRYETPAESEYLIANLLAPVGGGVLAQSVSQQEYSKLFERDRLGVSSSTEYLSRGAWIERGAQFGQYQNSSYLFEALYRTDPGERPNGDFEETELRLHLKQQITPQDSIYFRAIYYDAEGGDVRQYYNPAQASSSLRTREVSEPTLHLGYHHEWSPGIHTLLLGGWLNDRFSVQNSPAPSLFIVQPPGRPPTDFEQIGAKLQYRSILEAYTAELQQIFEYGDHHTILGGRYQTGEIKTENLQTFPLLVLSDTTRGYFNPNEPLADQDFHGDLERFSLYAYHDWQLWEQLRLIGGVTWDHLTYPVNFRAPPVSDKEEETERLSPKAGLVLTPTPATTFRFAWSRALSGVSVEQAYLLEPSQVGGFNQLFRSIVPESVSGSGIAARFETFGAALEQKLDSVTYLGLSGQLLKSREKRLLGAFRYTRPQAFVRVSDTPQDLDYTEKTFVVNLNRLIQKEWSVGVSYRLSHANLEDEFTEVPDSAFTLGVRPSEDLTAVLHQISLHAAYNAPSGWFAQFQALWSQQSNHGYSPDIPGDDFWQLNAYLGFRFPRRAAEVRFGLLNITDQDYRLNPLNLYNELPRSRTFAARVQFTF